jgi:hypothetical protein
MVCASRSRRELLVSLFFTLVISVPWVFVLRFLKENLPNNESGAEVMNNVAGTVIPLSIGFLPFFLQTSLPFDFRIDGRHLVSFRTFPFPPAAIVITILAVPVMLCLSCQAMSLLVISAFGNLGWAVIFKILLIAPAIAIPINCVWNIHYLAGSAKLISGTRQGGSSSNAVGTLLVVALCFAVFFPAGYMREWLTSKSWTQPSADLAGLLIQYAMDGLLVLVLIRLFQRFEVARDG